MMIESFGMVAWRVRPEWGAGLCRAVYANAPPQLEPWPAVQP